MFSLKSKLALVAAVLGAARAASAAPTSALQISETQINSSTYQYSLTLSDASSSTTNIGALWYAWIPGQDYLTTSPTAITSPAGWSLNAITGGTKAGDGYAIRWYATPGDEVVPGQSLSGFSFESTDPPSTIFGNSSFYPTTPTSTFFTYSGDAAFSGTSVESVGTAVPEPASIAILAPLAMLLGRHRSGRRA
jgi:hypothetical protein